MSLLNKLTAPLSRLLSALFTKGDLSGVLHPYLLTSLALLGTASLLPYVLTPLRAIWRHVLRPRADLTSRYQGTWALVTGASDGIGEQYSYELARSGFNIVLLSRTQEKLDKVARRLQSEYKVLTRIVQADLSQLRDVQQVAALEEKLERETGDLDICLLANNAGKAHARLIHEHSVEVCLEMVNTNINAQIFLSRYFLRRFQKRWVTSQKRSCVINVSSIAALKPMGMVSVYGATKAFNRSLS